MILTKSTFELYAAQNYNNPSCISKEEFDEDLCRFRYVKRLCSKYQETGEIKERLLLNHLVILYNLFGPACTAMLYFKISEQDWSVITPFMDFLGFLPAVVKDITPQILTEAIIQDENIKQLLKNL